jgi:replicative DNA helicase
MILLPSDPAAERSFVASMILCRSRHRMAAMVRAIKPAGREAFNDPYHAQLYDAVAGCWKEYGKCDAILLRAYMLKNGPVDIEDLVKILNTVPSAAHGPAYGAVILHVWRCREVYQAAVKLAAAAAKGAPEDELRNGLRVIVEKME